MREIDKLKTGWHVRALVLTILTLVSVAFPSRAQQDSTPEPSRLQLQEPLRLVAGSNLILTLPGLADRVALADETAASLRVISERELLVTGSRLAQTTVHVWLEDGSRLLYPLSIGSNLTLLESALQSIDPSITVTESVDGNTLVLTGELETAAEAGAAESLVEDFFGSTFSATGDAGAAAPGGPNIVNLIKYSTGEPSFEKELAEALAEIDPRINLRRIRVEREAFDRRDLAAAAAADALGDQNFGDSYVLTGRVRNLRGLSQALELADRFLGGGGGAIIAPQHVPIQGNQNNLAIGNNFNLGGGGAGGLQGQGGQGGQGAGGLGAGGFGQTGLGFGNDEQQAGLANWVSRGLNLTTAGGRVVSFLEVDALDQIMVSIRVLEIDRRRARSEGVNYVVNSTDFAIGNFTSPTGRFGVTDLVDTALDGADVLFDGGGAAGAAGTAANVVGAYVGDSTGVLSAIDYLERTGIGRSVAEPNILALTGEQSSIAVGGQVPIPTTAANNNAAFQGFFFQNFGVQLNIRATLDDEGIITLEASPSIVEPDEGLSVEGVPGFVTQSVATTARVKGDESLVIGGLINYDESVTERKIPVLGDIPLIKPLFRWKRKSRDEYELLFVITPHVRENLGVEGEQRQFDLPELDSRLVIPLKQEATPIKATPEGIPLNWLNIDEALSEEPAANKNPVGPGTDHPMVDPFAAPKTGEVGGEELPSGSEP